MSVTPINYSFLGAATNFYTKNGYKEIALPWCVPNEINMITCPDSKNILNVGKAACYLRDDREYGFIGSAEQSFIWLAKNHLLPEGKYFACTPCIRRFQPKDEYHVEQFLKVEIFQTIDVNFIELSKIVNLCSQFFQSLTTKDLNICIDSVNHEVDNIITFESCDLALNNIEIGSYGLRKYRNIKWLYGTGIAEPRFSTVLRRING